MCVVAAGGLAGRGGASIPRKDPDPPSRTGGLSTLGMLTSIKAPYAPQLSADLLLGPCAILSLSFQQTLALTQDSHTDWFRFLYLSIRCLNPEII